MKLLLSTSAGGKQATLNAHLAAFSNRSSLYLERLWAIPGVAGNYSDLLRQALPLKNTGDNSTSKPSDRWVLLPGLCNQAVSGKLQDADPVALAWLIFYVAAQLMDSVEDSDDPDPWWDKIGVGGALNVASGLFFCANIILSELFQKKIKRDVVMKVIQSFNRHLLLMCNGQHFDLTIKAKTLDDYWKIAKHKSGGFFGLVCEAGTLLGTQSDDLLSLYHLFGYHLGMLIQILDDLEDWYSFALDPESSAAIKNISNTLPVIYAMEVLPGNKRQFLDIKLAELSQRPDNYAQIVEIVDLSGVSIYLFTEMQMHYESAKNALKTSNGETEANELLVFLLESLYPDKLSL
jgi:geranylgeranyl pyrophosphate synthase